ncbi:multidrug transporter subunit MdtD [Bdellovibrio svalbardensis]|uniref:Multidrug transporter subunit MdtD n=1 Tax=Bdellovibrio svalbardensis TaxID=2972972 RepID=A0ABT6DK58_9BACT|nr:multidrug transporter subunit MdtD [Bdellovibrio svalbardensis]MDG0817245.1 multidrug transporter subunit MdtD [Bdellovibrio svalbardensis]
MSEQRSQNILLWLVAIGFFMETLDATIVNTALPSMAKSLGESPLLMQSVVIAYSLTIAIVIPASGWIADRFGTRKVFFSAILLFSFGSLACAFSQTLSQLVVSRVLQGMGGAMMMPVGRLAVLRAFPNEGFLRAISFVTIPALIGPLIGPTLGGWLVQFASWHWIFLINIPVGILGCIATYIYMPDSRGPERRHFDIPGFLMLSSSMVCISFALDGLSELGFQQATVMMLLIFGLASLCAYWLHARKSTEPLFSLQLFGSQSYTIGLMGNLFARIGSSSMPFLIPLLLQVSLKFTPFEAGMTMIPVALAGIFAKRLATPLILRLGYRNVLVGNTLCVGLAMASFSLFSLSQPGWLRLIQLLFFGTVNSIQFTAMNTLTLKDLETKLASSGNSLFSMIQMLAMSFAVAAAGALLSTFAGHYGFSDEGAYALQAFKATFICMGVITCSSAWIFWQLPPDLKDSSTEPVEAV